MHAPKRGQDHDLGRKRYAVLCSQQGPDANVLPKCNTELVKNSCTTQQLYAGNPTLRHPTITLCSLQSLLSTPNHTAQYGAVSEILSAPLMRVPIEEGKSKDETNQ